MAGTNSLIGTVDLTKRFGDFTAVDGITWEVHKGETKGILGPNGAGKTTFFNMISGVINVTSGSVFFKGDEITRRNADWIARRGISKTFQTNNLFEGESVVENVRFAAQVPEVTYDVFRRASDLNGVETRVDEILTQLSLEGVSNTKVEELSHGDQRKVEIAVALATDPDVILLDEPTSGVSNEEMHNLGDLIISLIDEDDITMVLIEHNVDFLMRIVDFVTVFHDGRILVEDTPDRIMANDNVQKVYLN